MQTKKWLGGEWHPANASNSLWMAPKFFPSYMQGQVHAELKAAAAMGLTALRVFLHNMAYDADPKAFLANIETFLTAAHANGLGVGFVFFDDCWNHAGASVQKQCQERPGLHNACSMGEHGRLLTTFRWAAPSHRRLPLLLPASPQDAERTNTTRFQPYITDLITAHKSDPRVLWWGMFNEPHRQGFSLELRHAAYGWAKAVGPTQPITSCWDKLTEPDNNDAQMQVGGFRCRLFSTASERVSSLHAEHPPLQLRLQAAHAGVLARPDLRPASALARYRGGLPVVPRRGLLLRLAAGDDELAPGDGGCGGALLPWRHAVLDGDRGQRQHPLALGLEGGHARARHPVVRPDVA